MKQLKLLLLLIFGLIAGPDLFAQTNSTDPHVICFGTTHPYRVDYTENAGAGTTGSTYAWSIPTAGFTGVITTNQGPGASSNAISINWGTTPPGPYVLQVIETNGGCPAAPMQLNIQVAPLPTIDAGLDVPLCIGSSTVLTATGGVSYAWSPATGLSATTGTSVTASPVADITYTVTGTDANGCVNTSTVNVDVNPLPTIGAGSNVAICAGGSTTLTATGGVTYTWSPATGLSATSGTSVTANPASTQTYTVTGTDVNGCQNTSTVQVTVNPLPTISATSGPTCAVDLLSYSVQVTVSAGTVTSTAGTVVNNSGNIWTISAVPTGTNITVTVTSSCPNTLTVNAPNCACPTVNSPVSGGNDDYCIGSPVPLISASVAGGQTVDWYSQASAGTLLQGTSLTYAAAGAGTYYAQARDIATGCVSSTRTAIIITENPLPTITAGSDEIICAGQSVTLTAGGGVTYTWNPTTGLTPTSGSPVSAAPASTQLYTVTGTDGNGCSAGDAVLVTVNPVPTISVTSGPTCAADLLTYSVQVTVSAGIVTSTAGTVTNTSGNIWNITAVTAGTNIVITVTNGGCPNTVNVNSPNCTCPVVAAPVFVANASYCIGNPVPSISVTVPGGIAVDWYNAATAGTLVGTGSPFTPTGAGTYYAQARDLTTGCVSSIRTTVTVIQNALPTISAGSDEIICQGDGVQLTATGGVSYTWSPTTGLSPTTGSPVTATPGSTLTYTVTGTDGNGCINTDSVQVIVNPVPVTSPIFHD